MPGSGKSFSAKREMTNTALLYRGRRRHHRPAGEFGLLAEAFGGRSVAFGPDSGTYLNLLDLSGVSELWGDQHYKIEAVLLSAASMAEGNEGLSGVERSIISRCVEKAYLTCGRAEPSRLQVLRHPAAAGARRIVRCGSSDARGPPSFTRATSPDRRITAVKDLPDNMRAFGIIAVLEAARTACANFERGVTTWFIDEVRVGTRHHQHLRSGRRAASST
ncbi:MAG: hypothetical protein ACLTMP_09335 [Eggerthella lenta]